MNFNMKKNSNNNKNMKKNDVFDYENNDTHNSYDLSF